MTEEAIVIEILSKNPQKEKHSLISILQEVQEKLGYLSPESMQQIGKHLGLSSAKVFGVATFYNQFRFHPPGKYHIQLCRGTACHVKGSANLLTAVKRELGIEDGQTTKDGLFSLETVACIGACGLAPVIKINDSFHGGVTIDDISTILKGYREESK